MAKFLKTGATSKGLFSCWQICEPTWQFFYAIGTILIVVTGQLVTLTVFLIAMLTFAFLIHLSVPRSHEHFWGIIFNVFIAIIRGNDAGAKILFRLMLLGHGFT